MKTKIPKCCVGCSGLKNSMCCCSLPDSCNDYVEVDIDDYGNTTIYNNTEQFVSLLNKEMFDLQKETELRNQICNIIEVDLRSLIEVYASSLFDYLHWNKNNVGENVKLYNNFKRIVQDRKSKVLKLFDERLQKIREGKEYE